MSDYIRLTSSGICNPSEAPSISLVGVSWAKACPKQVAAKAAESAKVCVLILRFTLIFIVLLMYGKKESRSRQWLKWNGRRLLYQRSCMIYATVKGNEPKDSVKLPVKTIRSKTQTIDSMYLEMDWMKREKRKKKFLQRIVIVYIKIETKI